MVRNTYTEVAPHAKVWSNNMLKRFLYLFNYQNVVACLIVISFQHPLLAAAELRSYPISFGHLTDSRFAATNGITLNKLAYDGMYRSGLVNHIPKPAQPWIETTWSVFWTFNFTMWPHDMGHWARANQAGGDFVIDEYRFPFPLARMVDAPNATAAEQTLMSVGGFEINSLMRWQHEMFYFRHGYRDADDTVHNVISTLLFPMYTLLIAPTNPSKSSTWDNTYGDPVDFAKLVYQHYTGRPAIRSDNSVDPSLVSLYREIFWMNILTTALDPMLYKSLKVFSMDLKRNPKIVNPWLVKKDNFAWAYTTRFNPGALGYEIYLTQHVRFQQYYFAAYARTGRPFKNRGLGLIVPALFKFRRFSLATSAEAWDQDVYGKGAILTLTPTYQINSRLNVSLTWHWKDHGYVVGHRLHRSSGWLLNSEVWW